MKFKVGDLVKANKFLHQEIAFLPEMEKQLKYPGTIASVLKMDRNDCQYRVDYRYGVNFPIGQIFYWPESSLELIEKSFPDRFRLIELR